MVKKMNSFRPFCVAVRCLQKGDFDAVESYISIQLSVGNTTMFQYEGSGIIVPHSAQKMQSIVDVIQSLLEEFVHQYVISSSTVPHKSYTVEMHQDDELRAKVLTGDYTVAMFLGLMERDPLTSVLDVDKISRFQLLHPPKSTLDSLLSLHQQDPSRFGALMQAHVDTVMREDTKEEWQRRHNQWQTHFRSPHDDASRFHAHLRESNDFLKTLQDLIDTKD